MFDHSVKVPRLYKTAAKIAKGVVDSKGSIKQLVYQGKHPNIKALYALVAQAFQKSAEIDDLLKKSKLLIKEPRFDPFLAKILITELLWGKKRLTGESKPIKTILAYEQILKAHMSDATDDFPEFQQVEKPRYVRINTLRLSVHEAVDNFRDEGWILKRFTDKTDYSAFLEAVSTLQEQEFMVDIHIPELLIFPPKTQFYKHPAYKNGSIILQDKASCLPVHILNPEPGSTVLDMCAAPGMKTTQVAAKIENQGTVYATEVKQKRFETLNQIVESSGATCVKTINRDVLTLTQIDCPDVKYILVDPSCSGSGITDRVEVGAQKKDEDPKRLDKLAGFQIKILRHALTKFHKAERVVYSTCSNYPEENEYVVRQVLDSCLFFKLVPAAQFLNNTWVNYGSPEFGDIGNFCLYSRPEMDLTNGFFVAVFERIKDGEMNPHLNLQLMQQYNPKICQRFGIHVESQENEETHEFHNRKSKKNKKKAYEDTKTRNLETFKDGEIKTETAKVEIYKEDAEMTINKRKKKKNVTADSENKSENNVKAEVCNEEVVETKSKKKKKKKSIEDSDNLENPVKVENMEAEVVEDVQSEKVDVTIKKKKKSKEVVPLAEDHESNLVGRKKKKVKVELEGEESIKTEIEALNKKTKKKIIETVEESTEKIVVKEENDSRIKKRKHENLHGTEFTKIKKKKQDTELLKIEDANIELETEVVPKKNKKKHSLIE